MASYSSRLRALGAGYALGVGGAVLALVFTLPAILALDALGVVSPLSRLVVGFITGQYLPFLGLPLAYLRWRGFGWAEIREYLGVRAPTLRELGIVLAGFLAVLVFTYAAAILVTEVLGLEPASNSAGQLAQELPRLIPLLIVASFLVIGPCEETLFRGGVQNRLRESYSAPVAISLAALLFAAVHVTALTGGLGARLTTVVILLVPSFVLGAVYEYTDNLVVSALVHGTWDAFLFAAIYVSVTYGGASGMAIV